MKPGSRPSPPISGRRAGWSWSSTSSRSSVRCSPLESPSQSKCALCRAHSGRGGGGDGERPPGRRSRQTLETWLRARNLLCGVQTSATAALDCPLSRASISAAEPCCSCRQYLWRRCECCWLATSMSASTGVSSDRSGANDLDAVAACRSTRLGSVGEPTDNAVWQVVAVGMSDLPQLAVGPALDLGNEAAAACTNGGDDQGAAG